MGIALELSRQPATDGFRQLGSLIVDTEGPILAQGTNRVYTDLDPTAHAK
jgi:tRNA(adenine34) deaminase